MSIQEKKKDLSFLPAGGRIYFVGIGGSSMSGLAKLSKCMGFLPAGSDNHLSARTYELEAMDIPVYPQTDADGLRDFHPDLVVYTAAILPGNPELTYAGEHNLPTVDRARFLGLITASFENVINISGTHGKTTTTAMTARILLRSGLDPTVHLGADLSDFGGSVHMGKDRNLFVSEACEFQRSFLQFYSTTAAITNIDYDHVDCYSDIDEVIDAFARFSAKLKNTTPGFDKEGDRASSRGEGILVVPAFDPNVAEAVRRMHHYREPLGLLPPKIISTGKRGDIFPITGREPDVVADNIRYTDGYPSFDVYAFGDFYAHIDLSIPGDHNIYNALTAIACAGRHGATPTAAAESLRSFTGADGRYTVKGKFQGATVVTDYAHHPSATRATLQAASKMPHNKTWVVYQPLTFKRTAVLFDDYVQSLLPCEHVILAEIFSDREINSGTVSSKEIADAINKSGGNAEFIPEKPEIKKRLSRLVGHGDLILLLGPEDIRNLAEDLI